MNKGSQKERVIRKLLHDGYITRNECLRNRITRLSAIILNLKDDGWDFKPDYVITKQGKDYSYKVIKSPYIKKLYTLPNGEIISKLVKN